MIDSPNESYKVNEDIIMNLYQEKEVVTPAHESILACYKEIEWQLLLHYKELTENFNLIQLNELLHFLRPTLGSKPFQLFYWFMIKEGAASWATIQRETNLCNSSLKNCLRIAMDRGIITQTGKQRIRGLKGGPRPTIYYLITLPNPEKAIQGAIVKHIHMSQGSDEVYRLAELLIKEIKEKPVSKLQQETTQREITTHIRKNAKPGYHVAGLVEPIKVIVGKAGIKVWV